MSGWSSSSSSSSSSSNSNSNSVAVAVVAVPSLVVTLLFSVILPLLLARKFEYCSLTIQLRILSSKSLLLIFNFFKNRGFSLGSDSTEIVRELRALFAISGSKDREQLCLHPKQSQPSLVNRWLGVQLTSLLSQEVYYTATFYFILVILVLFVRVYDNRFAECRRC